MTNEPDWGWTGTMTNEPDWGWTGTMTNEPVFANHLFVITYSFIYSAVVYLAKTMCQVVC